MAMPPVDCTFERIATIWQKNSTDFGGKARQACKVKCRKRLNERMRPDHTVGTGREPAHTPKTQCPAVLLADSDTTPRRTAATFLFPG